MRLSDAYVTIMIYQCGGNGIGRGYITERKEVVVVKVAMIGHKDFPSRSGGVEVMVGGLARSLVERGYDVTVYNRGLEKHHNVYDVDGVHARRVFTLQKPALNATVYSFLATFDALFRGYDVIHYHAIGPSVPLLIAKIFGKHTVCTVHGLNWKVDKWRGFASRYMKLGERIAAKYADDLVVLSETEWNYFLQKYGRASILIPNAIRFYEKRACSLIREKYGLARGEYILYVGRISPEKGTLDLVEGYRKAKTGKKLVLVGPLKELYSNCGLFVLPSHTEGLSLSLLEALSIGARCLVSDIPENTVVTDIYGAAFKPEDTDDLARALERECTQEYPDAMRQQQIQYIHTNFEYDVMLDRYEEVYHHVVGDPLKAMPSTLKKGRVPAGAKA